MVCFSVVLLLVCCFLLTQCNATQVLSGIAYGAFTLLVWLPIEVQLVTFALVAFFRALVFSVMATYVAVEFSFEHFGKLW